jgi:uncharacterized membrane protein YccC
VGLILDLAVAALAGLVIVSLALLAWTLAVSSVRAVRTERERVVRARQRVARTEERVRASAARASAALDELAWRMTSPTSGDGPDR